MKRLPKPPSPLHAQFNCSTLSGLEACAEPLCFDVFELQRQANGTVACVQVRVQETVPSRLIASLLLPYDYDYLFRFASDVEPLGASISTLVSSSSGVGVQCSATAATAATAAAAAAAVIHVKKRRYGVPTTFISALADPAACPSPPAGLQAGAVRHAAGADRHGQHSVPQRRGGVRGGQPAGRAGIGHPDASQPAVCDRGRGAARHPEPQGGRGRVRERVGERPGARWASCARAAACGHQCCCQRTHKMSV